MPDLTNALLDELEKNPTETLQNLVERLPRRLEAVIAANKEGTNSLKMSRCIYYVMSLYIINVS